MKVMIKPSRPIKSKDKKSEPIAVDVIAAMQRRKEEKGVSIHRSLDDAIRFALLPENREKWW